MRHITEVHDGYPGAEAVYESPLGEWVHLTFGSGDRVYFVAPGTWGATAVNVVSGGPTEHERRHQEVAAMQHHHEMAMRFHHDLVESGGAQYDGPPDPRLLSEEQSDLQGRMRELWAQVGESGGDPDALFGCAALSVSGRHHEWPDPRWVENLLMMGGNSAVMLWERNRDRRAALPLPDLAEWVSDLGWFGGGPSGLFEAHEAAAILAAADDCAPAREPEPAARADGPPAEAPTRTPAQWAPDPTGRHQHRYWDGSRWTDHVATDGVQSVDPLN